MTAGTPSSFAASATPCAWFPLENATTPPRFRSGESCAIVLYAPRNLNAPMRWRFSALRNTRAPPRPRRRTSRRTRLRSLLARHVVVRELEHLVLRVEQDLLVDGAVVERHLELVHALSVARRRVLFHGLDPAEPRERVGGGAEAAAPHLGGGFGVLQLRDRVIVVGLDRLGELARDVLVLVLMAGARPYQQHENDDENRQDDDLIAPN